VESENENDDDDDDDEEMEILFYEPSTFIINPFPGNYDLSSPQKPKQE
jgi:hypothetical protein